MQVRDGPIRIVESSRHQSTSFRCAMIRTLNSAAKPGVSPWVVALVVSMATFMEVLDTSIANVSLRHIAGNLGAGQDESTWVLTSYLVANAIIIPISGWLSSVMGRKRFYMTCVALFTISSFLCGHRAVARHAAVFPRVAGSRRRRTGAERAIDPGRHISAGIFRDGVCHLGHRGGGCAGHRSDPGRMDHRQLFLAMDFLHQHSRGIALAVSDLAPGAGSARR